MKIKLSKSQWEQMGKKAGWTDKLSEDMEFLKKAIYTKIVNAIAGCFSANQNFVDRDVVQEVKYEFQEDIENLAMKIVASNIGEVKQLAGRKAGWMKESKSEDKKKLCNICKKRPVWGQYGEYSRCKECFERQVDDGERASQDRGGDPSR